MGVNLGDDTWQVNQKYSIFSVIQKHDLSCDGVLLSKCLETTVKNSRCLDTVKLDLTEIIDPHFLMCLSLI